MVRIRLQCRRPGFDPWLGKIAWRRKWQPTSVCLPGKFHGQRSLTGYSPWACKESDMTEQLISTQNCIYQRIIGFDGLKQKFFFNLKNNYLNRDILLILGISEKVIFVSKINKTRLSRNHFLYVLHNHVIICFCHYIGITKNE